MPSYNISLKPSVEKDLRSLPKSTVVRVIEQIEGLKTDPLPRKALKLSNAEHLYRIRVGDYRIVYEVDTKTRQVLIHYVRHRREVYRSI
jgi:mRNA interferase RelE/StbE